MNTEDRKHVDFKDGGQSPAHGGAEQETFAERF